MARSKTSQNDAAERDARRAAALRANLRRRKDQQRARTADADAPPAADAPHPALADPAPTDD